MNPMTLDLFPNPFGSWTRDAFLILTIGWHQPIRLDNSQGCQAVQLPSRGVGKGLGVGGLRGAMREWAGVGWGKEQLRESRCLRLCAPVCVCLCARLGWGVGCISIMRLYVPVCECVCLWDRERANNSEKGGLCFTPVYVQGNHLT